MRVTFSEILDIVAIAIASFVGLEAFFLFCSFVMYVVSGGGPKIEDEQVE